MAILSTALVALAAFFWGLSGGIGAVLMANGWDAYVVALFRGGIGLVCVLAWLALRPGNSGLASGRFWLWSVVAGLGVAGNFTFYFISIGQGSIAVAATLMYCAPVFVYLVSFALKLERFTPVKAVAIALVLAGVVLLTQVYDVGAGSVTALGIGAGLMAGASYALFIFGFKFAAPQGSPQAILVIAFAVLVAVLFGLSDPAQVRGVPFSPDWPLFAALGVLGAGLSFVVYIVGLKYTTPALASIVAMVEPVTAALFGVVVLEDSLVAVQVFGMVLILVTVTALSVYTNMRKAPRPG